MEAMMDTTQTVILISIVNIIITGLVGGIVIYRIQKKIDATIQKSLFEHQTKFARSYPKSLEVLEQYNQKVLTCSRLSFKVGYRALELSLGHEVGDDVVERDRDALEKSVNECREYFENNRIHLSDLVNRELEDIGNRVFNLGLVSSGSVLATKGSLATQTEHVRMSLRLLNLPMAEDSQEETDLAFLAYHASEEFRRL